MKSFAILAGLLAVGVVAQPHGHKHRRAQHNHAHDKRDMVTVVETEIEIQTVTEYIDDTTTTWITPTAQATVTSSLVKAIPTTTEIPGQFHEDSHPSSSSSPAKESPATSNTPTTAPAVVVVPTTSTEAPAPPPATTTPVTTAPAPVTEPTTSTSAAAASPAALQPATGSKTGAANSGDLTYYTLGMGACGIDDSGNDGKYIVALSHLYMGEASNSNPLCGKTITITKGTKSIEAIVHDKCMGCDKFNIDVSEGAFVELAGDTGVGRTTVEWTLNE